MRESPEDLAFAVHRLGEAKGRPQSQTTANVSGHREVRRHRDPAGADDESRRHLSHDQDLQAHRFGRTVLTGVDSASAAPQLPEFEIDKLQSILDWARRQIHGIGWEVDPAEYRIAWAVHRLLGQLHMMVKAVPPVATPRNFRA